jgi:hypothetical protein
MVRLIAVVAALSLTAGAHAAEPKRAAAPAKKGSGGLSEAKRAVFNAKRALKTAVDLCDVPARCDPGSRNANKEYIQMLADADRNFIEACLACSTAEKCDAERDRIRAGKRSPGTAPCD